MQAAKEVHYEGAADLRKVALGLQLKTSGSHDASCEGNIHVKGRAPESGPKAEAAHNGRPASAEGYVEAKKRGHQATRNLQGKCEQTLAPMWQPERWTAV